MPERCKLLYEEEEGAILQNKRIKLMRTREFALKWGMLINGEGAKLPIIPITKTRWHAYLSLSPVKTPKPP